MTIELLDYANSRKSREIGNLEDIASIDIRVLTGDEIAIVVYKDYTTQCFDSSYDRILDFFDGCYTLYNIASGINRLNDVRFTSRKTSYDWFRREEEET